MTDMFGPEPICGFFGKYRFLSNFYDVSVSYKGLWFPTVEHAYQSAKVIDGAVNEVTGVSYAEAFSRMCSPGAAKTAGKNLRSDLLRSDWDEVKISVMKELLEKKFSPYRSDTIVSSQLRDTGDRHIYELNTWGDTFWGVVVDKKTGLFNGKNHLGRLLMEIREENERIY